ncbi:FecR domain-containing protein [Pedobacter nanyangensis]|uniref:FecR domain-containing protein n=1 Tax=Pedobacter nanyangensis TaxID=1562389 RepID=UPI000DE408CE|nr:FecR domain-containing protein [Pedobacter nanyangensis]
MNEELLIKFLLKETTAEETKQVQDWIAASSENAAHHQQLERIWNESANLDPKIAVDEELAWQKFKQRVEEKAASPVLKKSKPTTIWLRIAAVLVLCFGAWLAYQTFGNTYTNLASNAQVLNKALPDGSQLVLNKNTNISYVTDFKANRKVELISGEVFFDVAHDGAHPFVIAVNKVQVQVVGTSFNIKRLKNSVEVIVESGIVKVDQGSQHLTLTKGERVTLLDNEEKLVKEPVEDELYNYYRTQLFVANNTPLPKVIAVLNEAYGGKVLLSEDAKSLGISTTLPFKYSLEENLNTICRTLNLKMNRNGDQISLSKK